MLKKEKYKDKLEDILVKTIAVYQDYEEAITRCGDRPCDKCIFFINNKCGSFEAAKEWLNSEYKESILTKQEKEYLSSVVKPFRDKVKSITKFADTRCTEEYIYMVIEGPADACLPRFDGNTMYKGMELGKEYTLEELGI
jgi:hypothetical protein